MQRIEIVKGVEMPSPKVIFDYPYEEMDVGDSFAVPV